MAGRKVVDLVAIVLIVVVVLGDRTEAMSKEEKKRLKDKAVEMFQHAYVSYMQYAYPADELMPLTCTGRTRETLPSRGDIDDSLGNFSLTLIDTLDSLAVLGLLDEFESAVRLVIRDVTFDTDLVVSVFETNIRVLGGLLGAHVVAADLKKSQNILQWYNGELLDMAKDIGYRLLPAFNTSTGIPYPRVNLRHGLCKENSRTGQERDTCTACAGTMILEFAALSRLTGEPVFEEKAHRAMEFLWEQRHQASDLVGTVINIHNGDWVRRESGVGAGIDSYYEYLLKAYILLGDDSYLDRFNRHYSAIMQYVNQGPLLVDVHMHRPDRNSRNFMDSLLAFWPGLQVLKGDLKSAIEIHEMLYQVTKRHNFLPEAFTTDFRVHWGQHPLRPEFVESTYFLYKATGDPHYLDVGASVLNNLETHARVRCGFAAIKDVTTGLHENQMDSFVLAETFKYLYLLFAEPKDLVLNIDSYVFTTEAHLLPLTLSLQNHTANITKVTVMPPMVSDEDEQFERSCQNVHMQFQGNLKYYAQNIRKPMENYVEKLCPKPKTSRAKRRLRATEFVAGKPEHLAILKQFGIKLATLQDGRVQLLHTAADAASPEDAQEGLAFMQEMIELSQSQQQDSQQEPRVVQLMSSPYNGKTWMSAGPALFGLDLKTKPRGVRGRLIVAETFDGCSALANCDEVRGKIPIVQRGGCMFIEKAVSIEKCGGIGGVVIDNHPGSTSTSSPLFAMSGDGKTEVAIPFLFLFRKEGEDLLEAVNQDSPLTVLLAVTPVSANDLGSQKEVATIQIKQLNDNIALILETMKNGDVKYDVSLKFGRLNFDVVLVPYGNSNIENDLISAENAEYVITYNNKADTGHEDDIYITYRGLIPLDENMVPDSVYINIAVRKLLTTIASDTLSDEVRSLITQTEVRNAYGKALAHIIESALAEKIPSAIDNWAKLFEFIPMFDKGEVGDAEDFFRTFVAGNPFAESRNVPAAPPKDAEHYASGKDLHEAPLSSGEGAFPQDFIVRVAPPSMKVTPDHFYINAVEKIIYVTQERYDKYVMEIKANSGNSDSAERGNQGKSRESSDKESAERSEVADENLSERTKDDSYVKLVERIQKEMEEEDRQIEKELEFDGLKELKKMKTEEEPRLKEENTAEVFHGVSGDDARMIRELESQNDMLEKVSEMTDDLLKALEEKRAEKLKKENMNSDEGRTLDSGETPKDEL